MKKLALTSLLAVFAVSGAHAANVIDGNPLYLPGAGHFYSVSSIGSHTGEEDIKNWALGEEFGYGITNKLAVNVATSLSEYDNFDAYFWDYVSLGATYRALDMGGWKLDVMGAYKAGDAGLARLDPDAQGALMYHFDDETEWFDKEATLYTWTVGVRGGYTMGDLTLAGHAAYEYINEKSFKWNEDGAHRWVFGLDAQYVLDSHWSALAGVEYSGYSDSWAENEGLWTAELGVNYNIDATKFVGVYASADMDHKGGDDHEEWHVQNGFGFGAKFGIDF